MSDGEDTPMEREEVAAGYSSPDQLGRDPGRDQLASRDDPVLALGELANPASWVYRRHQSSVPGLGALVARTG